MGLSRATERVNRHYGARKLAALALLTVLMFEITYAFPYYALSIRSVATSQAPNVVLQSGNFANATLWDVQWTKRRV